MSETRMARAVQQRTLKTRARLVEVAKALIEKGGYEPLRVEDVVRGAGVAKGTFFAHFRDKDALMELLIGAELGRLLERIAQAPVPETAAEMVDALNPAHQFMTSERYVFDVIIRFSGAAGVAEIGPIAECFERYYRIVEEWVSDGRYRTDLSADLLAEGVQAFAIQAMSLQFCALHSAQNFEDRLQVYLEAWLSPATVAAG